MRKLFWMACLTAAAVAMTAGCATEGVTPSKKPLTMMSFNIRMGCGLKDPFPPGAMAPLPVSPGTPEDPSPVPAPSALPPGKPEKLPPEKEPPPGKPPGPPP